MARELPRTPFHRSQLVRVLSELADPDVPDSGQPFAERLGQWLDFKGAMALFSVLKGKAEPRPQAPSAEAAALWEAFDRARAALVEGVTADGALRPGKPASGTPAPEGAADFAPFHRYYHARQREMTASVAALRASARAALSRHSPALKRLAALDTMLDQAMAAREGSLLATVPALLARRFEQLATAPEPAPAEASTAQAPDRQRWLTGFREEMQAVLLAELDLRLQPVAGLIAALDNEGSRSGE